MVVYLVPLIPNHLLLLLILLLRFKNNVLNTFKMFKILFGSIFDSVKSKSFIYYYYYIEKYECNYILIEFDCDRGYHNYDQGIIFTL